MHKNKADGDGLAGAKNLQQRGCCRVRGDLSKTGRWLNGRGDGGITGVIGKVVGKAINNAIGNAISNLNLDVGQRRFFWWHHV